MNYGITYFNDLKRLEGRDFVEPEGGFGLGLFKKQAFLNYMGKFVYFHQVNNVISAGSGE